MPKRDKTPRALKINALVLEKGLKDFIRDAFRGAGFTKGIVGLSGGVDSALVATLGARALGVENVLAVLMPYRTSSPGSISDAVSLAEQLGIRHEKVDISPMVDAYLSQAGGQEEPGNIRKGNVMARQRMIVLYDISARESALVMGTSNKTEIMLGYGTQFGDTACAINPIGDLYKTQVWQLAEALGVPKMIVDKKPTADLWAGQTDEGELGFSYRQVDRLLYFMFEERLSLEDLIKKGFDKSFIEKVKMIVRRNRFKSRPPIIARVSRLSPKRAHQAAGMIPGGEIPR